MSHRFRPDSLPTEISVFPLAGALLLPRGNLPLNIFEPRYLAMVRAAIAGDRMIGMVQPRSDDEPPGLYDIGGLGRITQFAETDDGRFMIVLTGICRFRIERELETDTPYRRVAVSYASYDADWQQPAPLSPAERAALEDSLRRYLDSQDMSADWDAVSTADDESLVNSLAGVCPFDIAEKQALLEAPDLNQRTSILTTLMSFAAGEDGHDGQTMH